MQLNFFLFLVDFFLFYDFWPVFFSLSLLLSLSYVPVRFIARNRLIIIFKIKM